MILAVIVGCEVAFWIAVATGLALRYLARQRRASTLILALIPLVDIVLLAVVAWNLRTGGTATTAHSLATFYLGFTVTYGHRMIAWADVRFAHRYAGGPAPVRLTGTAHTRQCWADVRRTAIACGLAAVIAWALIAWNGESARTAALQSTYTWALILTGGELLHALSYTIWPRRDRQPPSANG